ncbi:MAG: HAD family hydrolase [Burkholderiales bacterium]|nr:HAD family hydrolase [Burkholderiales bacterium]
MRYFVLASDYDGTLATDGRVSEETLAALRKVKESGRKLVLVTGRELPELKEVFPGIDIFDLVVAENGALLYNPVTKEERPLGSRPPSEFVPELRRRGVERISEGRVIVATWEPHEVAVFETIRDLGLELQVIFNKGAVMVLPSGINKATGLCAALAELGLSPHNAVGVGDAENDHAFLQLCECGVAVANALPITKEQADLVTQLDHGAGVVELCNRLLANDLRDLELRRPDIEWGKAADDALVAVAPYGENILISGTSGGGKSTLASGFLERLAAAGYQFCIVDPEGDYNEMEDVVVLGDARRGPNPEVVLDVLNTPGNDVVVNMIGVVLEHRPEFFEGLFARLQQMRNRFGRPHWILIDEAHHLFPVERNTPGLSDEAGGVLFLTVHPDHVSPVALKLVDVAIAIGQKPEKTLATFAEAVGGSLPEMQSFELEPGDGVLWRRDASEAKSARAKSADGKEKVKKKRVGKGQAPIWFRSTPPTAERHRHLRKYMEGELEPEISFYFTGPERKLNLRAQNLQIFLQLADGLDDDTWRYHLQRGDYSRWLAQALKDGDLSEEVAQIEQDEKLDAKTSRSQIRERIEARYTAPE